MHINTDRKNFQMQQLSMRVVHFLINGRMPGYIVTLLLGLLESIHA